MSFLNWTWKTEEGYYDEKKNLLNSYDGTSAYLIGVWFINLNLDFKHVIPGNYKLYINEAFLSSNYIIEQANITVFIGEKKVYSNEKFPNSGENQELDEHFICDIRLEDFDSDSLDNNGDAIIKIMVRELSNAGKKSGWIFDGYRLLEVN